MKKLRNTQNNAEDEIRIGDIFHVLVRHKMLIITLAVCGLVVGIVLSIFSYMKGEMKRTYAVTSAIAVTSQTKDGLYTNKEVTPNSTDITLAENMADSVIYVIKSDKTLNAAIRRLSLVGISVSDIYKNLTVTKYGSTQIIEMTLYWRNAEEGVEILDAINAVAPSVLAEVLQIGNVSVVNNPKSQYRIGGSVNAKLWLLMVLAGMAGGIGLIVLDMFLRPRLIESEDMTRKFDLKLLGEIPEDSKFFTRSFLTLSNSANSPMDERFTSIARILEYDMRDEANRCFCLTSSSQKEGTSSMAAQLAFHMAEMERKVLLVDLHIKNPMLGMLLDDMPDYYHSLNGYYYGDSSRTEVIHPLTQDLDLLPCVLDSTHPLFMNSDLNDLLSEIAKGYDYVFLDLPPVKVSSDVMSMRSLTDKVLFVARCDAAFLSDMEDSLERISKAGMRVVGCIVNGMTIVKEKPAYQAKKNGASSKQRTATLRVASVNTGKMIRETVASEISREHKNKVLDDSLSRGFEEYRP